MFIYHFLKIFTFAIVFSFLPTIVNGATLSKAPNNLGLAGYWSFNEGSGTVATDFSGNGNTGTISGTTWIDGKAGNAISLDGSDDYVSVGNGASLRPSNAISICSWVLRRDKRVPDLGAEQDIIVRSSTANTGNYVLEYNNSGGTEILFFNVGGYTNTGYIPSSNVTVYELNKWFHLCVTYSNGGSASFYVNGQPVTAGVVSPETDNIPTNVETVYIGGKPSGGDNTNGNIDEVRIYNRVLSASEVATFYRLGSVSRSATNNLGLIAHWSFDEGDGVVATDYSGNNRGGVLTNSPAWTSGKLGKAIYFDGSDDYVISNISGVDLAETTVSFWVNPSSIPGGQTGIFQWADQLSDGDPFLLIAYSATGQIRYYVDFNYQHSVSLPTNTWSHVSVTLDSSDMWRFYINGTEVDSFQGAALRGNQTTADKIYFGNGYSAYFNGIIDDVRIYNRALPAGEIVSLLNTKSSVINSTQTNLVKNGLVGYWPFDGKYMNWSTNQALDASGNGRNLTLINMSTTTSPLIGKIGQALVFTSANSNHLRRQDETTFDNLFSEGITFSVWAKYPNFADYQRTVNIAMPGNANYDVWLQANPDSKIQCGSGGGVNYYSGTTALSPNTWYHVVCVTDYTDGGSRIYINGVNDTLSVDGTPDYIADKGSLYIGALYDGIYGDAVIDDVRVYNKPLTETEVQQLYRGGR